MYRENYKSGYSHDIVCRWNPADCSCRYKTGFRPFICTHTNFTTVRQNAMQNTPFRGRKFLKNISEEGHCPCRCSGPPSARRGHHVPTPYSRRLDTLRSHSFFRSKRSFVANIYVQINGDVTHRKQQESEKMTLFRRTFASGRQCAAQQSVGRAQSVSAVTAEPLALHTSLPVTV